jgi:hypothetical protein
MFRHRFVLDLGGRLAILEDSTGNWTCDGVEAFDLEKEARLVGIT